MQGRVRKVSDAPLSLSPFIRVRKESGVSGQRESDLHHPEDDDDDDDGEKKSMRKGGMVRQMCDSRGKRE